MIGLLFVTFIIGRVMPIDPVLSVVGERASKEVYQAAYLAMGLDKPAEDIRRVFPATLELATLGTLIGVLVGVPLGVVSAVKRDSWIDQIARVIALVGYSMPIFWLGLVGLFLFYGVLGWVGGPGRISIFYMDMVPPVTGMILIDSALDAQWDVFRDAISH